MIYTSTWMLEHPDTTPEEMAVIFDEAMLRLFIYGSVELVRPCDMVERIYNKLTFEKTYPTKFAHALIEHITRYGNCYAAHQDHNEGYNEMS